VVIYGRSVTVQVKGFEVHRHRLVRQLGAQAQDAADADGRLVPQQDRTELCRHARHTAATMLDDLGF
jgi:hypothetical protein